MPGRSTTRRFWITGWAGDCWAGLQQWLRLPCRPSLSTGSSWRFLSYRAGPKPLDKDSPCWYSCVWSRTAVQKGINVWNTVTPAEVHKVQGDWMTLTATRGSNKRAEREHEGRPRNAAVFSEATYRKCCHRKSVFRRTSEGRTPACLK